MNSLYLKPSNCDLSFFLIILLVMIMIKKVMIKSKRCRINHCLLPSILKEKLY